MDGFWWLLLKAVVPWLVVLQLLPVMIFLERKGSALIADRVGPNRAYIPGLGLRLAGMVHNLSDVVKLVFKEDFVPNHVSRRMYLAAPMLSTFVALVVGAVIPFTPPMAFAAGNYQIQALDAGVGILFTLAVSSIGVYSVTLAGWASNNKFSLLGGLRASAQMISYEIALGLAVVGLFMLYGNTTLDAMVAAQGANPFTWGVVLQPIGFVLFLVGGFAETNRNPFDLAEGESEIVGFHVEYGGVRFALFMMAEYIHMVIVALILATCFFGGYQVPFISMETLQDPGNAGILSQILLWLIGIGGLVIGMRLLVWHKRNRAVWHDSRRREGAVLAVLFGFAPAATALAVWSVWSGDLGAAGGQIFGGFLGFLALMTKALFFCWLFVWVRWTTPRFRYDQLMRIGWRFLIPIGIANIFITGLGIKLWQWIA